MARTTADVVWEDQEKINRFSYLSMAYRELEKEAKVKEESLSALQDAMDEIELLMGDTIRLLIGESLVAVPEDIALARLEEAKDKTREELQEVQASLEEHSKEMSSLKNYLYARFGGSINLEE